MIRCGVCQRRCTIAPGQTGFCQTRINLEGKLYSTIYGVVANIGLDPVEKKPLYHFYPGTQVLSISTFGCNFRCKQCLNFSHTWGANKELETLCQVPKIEAAEHLTKPEEIINLAKKYASPGIAFTYNEPTIWLEYVLEVAKLAKKNNLYTVFVTNGSFTTEALKLLGPYIDAMNIDFKGFSDKTYQKFGGFFGQIPEVTSVAVKNYHIHMEITTLLIPTINDDWEEITKMTRWIVDNLGPKTPWHLSRFDPYLAPDPQFQKIPPTPISSLRKAEEIGEKAGLQFIYTWTAGSEYFRTDTFCPKCGQLTVERGLWQPKIVGVTKDGRCRKCGEDLNIRINPNENNPNE